MAGLRNHSFIIPRPKQKNKRKMPEMQGKSRESLIEHLLSGHSPVGKVFSGAQHNFSEFVRTFLGDIVSVDEKDFGLPECPDRHAYPQFIVIDEHVAMRPDIVLFPVVFQKIKIIENIQLFSVFEEDQIMVFGIID